MPYVLALAAAAALAGALLEADEPDLTVGIQQYRNGEFDAAVLTLDAAARRLAGDPAQAKELARVFLYLGATYLGLGQESIARAKFLKALQHDSALRPNPQQLPRRVLRVFEAAREAAGSRTALEEQARKKKGKGGLVLAGIGGAAAVGLAVALGPALIERGNSPPTAGIQVQLEGIALVYATVVKFTASGSDPEGEPVTFTWDFGDGSGSSGPTASHVYRSRGSFTVILLATDGLRAVTTATAPVTVGDLTGTWRVVGAPVWGASAYRLSQGSSNVSVEPLDSAGRSIGTGGWGMVNDPRRVELNYSDPSSVEKTVFRGDADAPLQRLDGCVERINSGSPCTPVVLVRQ